MKRRACYCYLGTINWPIKISLGRTLETCQWADGGDIRWMRTLSAIAYSLLAPVPLCLRFSGKHKCQRFRASESLSQKIAVFGTHGPCGCGGSIANVFRKPESLDKTAFSLSFHLSASSAGGGKQTRRYCRCPRVVRRRRQPEWKHYVILLRKEGTPPRSVGRYICARPNAAERRHHTCELTQIKSFCGFNNHSILVIS